MAGTQPLSDLAVRAARSGDSRALEGIVRVLADELMPLASALTGGSGEADALVGDTLSRVYERLDQLRENSAILPWARRILVRRFLDERRWSLRRPRSSGAGRVASPPTMTTSATHPDAKPIRAAGRRIERAGRRRRSARAFDRGLRPPRGVTWWQIPGAAPRIEAWDIVSGRRRTVADGVRPLGVLRVDGSAAITTSWMLVDLRTGGATEIPGADRNQVPYLAVKF